MQSIIKQVFVNSKSFIYKSKQLLKGIHKIQTFKNKYSYQNIYNSQSEIKKSKKEKIQK